MDRNTTSHISYTYIIYYNYICMIYIYIHILLHTYYITYIVISLSYKLAADIIPEASRACFMFGRFMKLVGA